VTDPQKEAVITTTRLPVNIVIALCYLWIWVSGIVMLLIERRNRTVRFHACQSILTFGALTLILFLLSFLPPVPFGFIYYSVLAVWAILIAVGAYLWILLLIRAFQGKPYTLPLIGSTAGGLADWFETRFIASQPQTAEIEHSSEEKSPGPKFCVVCGKKLPEKAIFCPECGEKQFHEVLAQIDRLGRTIESEQAVNDRRITTAVRKALDATVNAVTVIGEKRDPYTAGHQRRVTTLARAIAGLMNLPPARMEGLVVAGQLHDIGKISVPSDILNKPGRLSDGEMTVIRSHSQVSYDILKNIEFPWPVAQIAYQHHERLDGSGYPQGLRSPDILLEAKILCVADVVEAMASHRPYRPALGIDKALDEISKNKGKLYDPDVVDACVKLFKEQDFKFD
jgi:putative nucleotidyltransferase with HDIG domain